MKISLKVWLKICLYVLYKTCAGVNPGPMGQDFKNIYYMKMNQSNFIYTVRPPYTMGYTIQPPYKEGQMAFFI